MFETISQQQQWITKMSEVYFNLTTLVDFFHSHGIFFLRWKPCVEKVHGITAAGNPSLTNKQVRLPKLFCEKVHALELLEGFLAFDSKVCLYVSLNNLRTRQVLV